MVFSFGLATMLVAHQSPATSLAEFFSMRIKVGNFAIFAVLLSSGTLSFPPWDCTAPSGSPRAGRRCLTSRRRRRWGPPSSSLRPSPLRMRMVTPFFILIFWAAGTLAGVASRVLLRGLLAGVRRRGRNLRQMVVVGTNPRALRFARKLEARPELGYRIAGFVDGPWMGLGMFLQTGYQLVSDLPSFPRFLREQVVDEVVIALPMESSYGQAARIAALCEEQGIIVRLLSRHVQPAPGAVAGGGVRRRGRHHAFHRIAGRLAAPLEAHPGCRGVTRGDARAVARVFAGRARRQAQLARAGLVRQDRVGLGKRRFRLYKFRTMVADAEKRQREVEHLNEASGPVFKIRNDPALHARGEVSEKDEHR